MQHRNDNGLNVRVINLSFGTDGTQDAALDPLAYATEVAWRMARSSSSSRPGTAGSAGLTNPARDPWVIAVGAVDTKGTLDKGKDDTIPAFSSRGNGVRNPDFVAPGQSVQSLRVPNAALDALFPGGRLTDTIFKGTGTSQAAAVTSGAAALILSKNPTWTPDQVKNALVESATKLKNADATAVGRRTHRRGRSGQEGSQERNPGRGDRKRPRNTRGRPRHLPPHRPRRYRAPR